MFAVCLTASAAVISRQCGFNSRVWIRAATEAGTEYVV